MKRLTCLSLFLIACGTSTSVDDTAALKNAARAAGDGEACERHDWYGDGVCDDFCSDPDPDCGECPSFVEHHSCFTFDAWSCPAGTTVVTDPDGCGCGCVAAVACEADADCPELNCVAEPCPTFACEGGWCEVSPTDEVCEGDADCPEIACFAPPCPDSVCVEGRCDLRLPEPPPAPTCMSDDDCAIVCVTSPCPENVCVDGVCEEARECPSEEEAEYRSCFTFEAWDCPAERAVVDPEGCGCYCLPRPAECPAEDEVEYRVSCFTFEAWDCPAERAVVDPDGCGCYCRPE
ncbi:MAG: hypothetical protein AAGE52_02980 [Myxococcota bacterium]